VRAGYQASAPLRRAPILTISEEQKMLRTALITLTAVAAFGMTSAAAHHGGVRGREQDGVDLNEKPSRLRSVMVSIVPSSVTF
jgi:hypothetical protein